MRSGSIFWGIVLVLFGGVLLAQNMGLVPPGVNIWAIFWPLALVAFGAQMLLRSIRPSPVRQEEVYRLPLNGTRRATLRVHHGAGELRIDGSAAADEVLSGSFAGGVNPVVQQGVEDVIVDLRTNMENFQMLTFEGSDRGLNWTVGVNPNLPIILDLEVGASRNFINLRDTQVKSIRLQTGASATEIDFPARAGEVRADLHSGMASVEARIPEGVSAHIRTRGALSSVHVDTTRFPQVSGGANGLAVGSEYRSADYDLAANRLELDIESGVGSVQVR